MSHNSGTLSGFALPTSHSFVSFPFHASNSLSLRPRLVSLRALHSLASLQTEQAASTERKEGVINEGEKEEHDAAQDYDDDDDWEAELLDELDPLLCLRPGTLRRARRQRHFGKTVAAPNSGDASAAADWAEQARQRALLALEARNPTAASLLKKKIEPQSDVKKNKKKKEKKKPAKNGSAGLLAIQTRLSSKRVEKSVRMADDDDIDGLLIDSRSDLGTWQLNENRGKLIFSPEVAKNKEQVIEREKVFNRRLVEAKDAQEVLEVVGNAEERIRLLGFPSLLTPLNAATALHRIAKHMETSGTPKSDRLAFARKKYMAELVARAMEVLSGCSAQGLSNIAWALSKVGGSSLYFSEMDRIAEVALAKISEFNAQNVANTLGAYASMQHAVPSLFASLSDHVCDIVESFNSQELAQVLWAHAELSQPADPLLDVLDSVFLLLEKTPLLSVVSPDSCAADTDDVNTFSLKDSSSRTFADIKPYGNASAEHLANLAWSYAVLNQIDRPSFKYFWQMLDSVTFRNAGDSSESKSALSTWHLSQVHQVNLCLQYEYPQSGLILRTWLKDLAAEAWEKHKSYTWSTSTYQKDVKWLLVSMGENWVAEYTAADYSLDLALVEEKTAIEFDGPSHFIRNTGLPLGHTILKRRLLTGSGWRVLSIPYEEWEELNGEAEQMRYLKELLKSGA